MEYTLEDALDMLNDKKVQKENYIEDLINNLSNNEISSLKSTSSLEEIKVKQEKLQQILLKEVRQVQPENYPIPFTSDLRVEAITKAKEEVFNFQELLSNLEKNLSDIQENIVDLKNKKDIFKKVQSVYLDSTVTSSNMTYERELRLTKRIFRQVKNDLTQVVHTIFPHNDNFHGFLAALTTAYVKGGDDVYVDVTPDVLNYVNFLLEANVVTYHRNDKMKVRMVEYL